MTPQPNGTEASPDDDAQGRLVTVPDEEKRLRFSMFASRRKALLSDIVKSAKGGFTPRPRRGAA